jgi:hypothetical protein
MAVIEALSTHPNGIAQHVLILRLNGKPGTVILLRILPEPPLNQMEKLIRSKRPREEIGNVVFNRQMNPARSGSGVFIFVKLGPISICSSHPPDFSGSFHLTSFMSAR